ncbi:NAD-dependent DNA ligase LigA [Campylobacter ureolyticus]|uniref:DNA ligase n=1 Tax=Campylobacter ureolyticus TaxID=827 RepID=A0A6N2SXZ1_9BACT
MTRDEYIKAIDLLNLWARAYYMYNKPLVTDEEYDNLYNKVLEYESQHPNFIESYSQTQKIGRAISDGFEKLAHINQMWSMEDIFNDEELLSWLKRGEKAGFEFYCEPKFDGASLNLLYENGILKSAATRGDGVIGEDVTQNAKVIKSIPLKIDYTGKIEIRGEVVISKSDFDELNLERSKNGELPLANPRNAAAGSLRQLDSSIVAKRKLKFIPWDAGYNELGLKTHFEIMSFIRKLGFLQDSFIRVCKTKNEIAKAYDDLVAKRDDKEILMDGMVIRINLLSKCQELGYTVKFPKFMVAYKFKAVEKVTRLKDIALQVGRSGVVTPVGVLEPVEIDGAIVKNATLHNFDEIKRLGLMKNDFVNIIRSGDVIPKITSVYKDRRDGSQIEISRPTTCPVCGSHLLDEGVFVKCQNLDCKARVINSLIYFASKKCMNIDGLGEAIVKTLFEEGKIAKIPDIYNLKKEDLKNLEGFKDKKIANLLNAINSSKNSPLYRFITSLGIEHIGEVAAKKLDESFGLKWIDAKKDDFLNLDGFGEAMAESLVEFIETNMDKIINLTNIINPKPSVFETKNSAFNNKTVVITGTLSKSRDYFKDLLLENGAKVTNSVSKKTDFLLCGNEAGSKLENALKLGVKVIDESEFLKLLESEF